MPKLDLESFPQSSRSSYPPPFAEPLAGRRFRRLGPQSGLTDITVSHVVLDPGAWSAQRHWHAGEDEFVVMVSGEAVLVDDSGRTILRPGDCAAFPKGEANGHHLVNESDAPCVFVAIGGVVANDCHYPDIDLRHDAALNAYVHKDGTRY